MTSTTSSSQSRPVHLWLFNHPIHGVSDQIEYFRQAFEQAGYPVSYGNAPKPLALNVVIENFSVESRETIEEFCRETGHRVAVIMTEHIDFRDGALFIHGDPLWTGNDYMHPATQIARLRNLFFLLPNIRCVFVLGDLPELQNFDDVMNGVEICTIPFPDIPFIDPRAAIPPHDLVFTGFMTQFRDETLAELKVAGLRVKSSKNVLTHDERDALNATGRLVLNLPQRPTWKWLSSMRILAALRCGRATVSLGTADTCEMAAATYQIDTRKAFWHHDLRGYVESWQDAYETAFRNYGEMAKAFRAQHPFPHDMMDYWAITDRMCKRTFAHA